MTSHQVLSRARVARTPGFDSIQSSGQVTRYHFIPGISFETFLIRPLNGLYWSIDLVKDPKRTPLPWLPTDVKENLWVEKYRSALDRRLI